MRIPDSSAAIGTPPPFAVSSGIPGRNQVSLAREYGTAGCHGGLSRRWQKLPVHHTLL
jgi:hypothetical protein